MTLSGAAVLALLPDERAGARVAVLGGSFNPPHLGHALLAHAVLSVARVDAVWVTPCASHPFGKALAPFEARRAMCELAFRHLGDHVRLVELEARLPAPSYTVDTLRAIRGARPDLALTLVVGADAHAEMHLWKEHEALPALAELLVVPRVGWPSERAGSFAFTLPNVASRDLRSRLARGEDVAGMVDDAVASYARAHGLYRGAEDPSDGPRP